MMGPGYIADSLQAATLRRVRQESWQCYVGDLLRLMATAWGAENVARYAEIIHPKTAKPAPAEDPRTAEEIVADLMERHHLTYEPPAPKGS